MLMAIPAVLALAEGQKQSDLAVPNGEPPLLCHHLQAKGVCGAWQGHRRLWGAGGGPELSSCSRVLVLPALLGAQYSGC